MKMETEASFKDSMQDKVFFWVINVKIFLNFIWVITLRLYSLKMSFYTSPPFLNDHANKMETEASFEDNMPGEVFFLSYKCKNILKFCLGYNLAAWWLEDNLLYFASFLNDHANKMETEASFKDSMHDEVFFWVINAKKK